MKLGLFSVLAASLVVCAIGSNIPNGFIPLQPLPIQHPTQKPKQTLKPTFAPITKKPTTTKAPVTPFPTQPPTPAPTQPPTQPPTAAPTQPPTPMPTSRTAAPNPTTNPKNCGLNVNVPQANCKGANGVIQQTLATLRQELSNTKKLSQAQNTAVQTMISQLQGQQSGYLTKIADLQNEVRNLVGAFNSLSGPSSSTVAPSVHTPTNTGLPSSAVRQAISNVRNDMQHAIGDFNNKFFNLTLHMQDNQLKETKLHQSIEAQIQQQAGQIGQVAQQVSDLNRQLQQLNTSGPSASPGASAAAIAQLKAKVLQVASDIKQYDTQHQSNITSLAQQAAGLAATVTTQTSDIRGLQLKTTLAQSTLTGLKKDVTLVHDALQQFRTGTNQQMNNIKNDIQDLKTNVSRTETNVKGFGTTVLTVVGQSAKATAQINGLDSQVQLLKKDIPAMNQALQTTGAEVAAIKQGLIDLKKAVPLTELTKMKNVVLVAINHGNITQQDLKDLSQVITAITAKLSQISLPTPSG